jgi:hypothetical protein
LPENGIPPSSQKDNEFARRKMRKRLEYFWGKTVLGYRVDVVHIFYYSALQLNVNRERWLLVDGKAVLSSLFFAQMIPGKVVVGEKQYASAIVTLRVLNHQVFNLHLRSFISMRAQKPFNFAKNSTELPLQTHRTRRGCVCMRKRVAFSCKRGPSQSQRHKLLPA